MHQLLLEPADVLFFRDGRPMMGASTGHGAAWPLPNVVNAALHAALHRGLVEKVEQNPGRTLAKAGRTHAEALPQRNGERTYLPENEAARHFTDLWSVGPFPVKAGRWFFPRPADAQNKNNAGVTHLPYAPGNTASIEALAASLPVPLRFTVGHTREPSKVKMPAWFSADAMHAYIDQSGRDLADRDFAFDSEFADTEYTVGIAIDPNTQTTGQGEAESRIYSAQYLRLVEHVRLGLLAGDATPEGDTIEKLFPCPGQIVVGGQQRVCHVIPTRLGSGRALPLPLGITDTAKLKTMPGTGKYLVKWVLLTPTVWPEIGGGKTGRGADLNPHHGGWLPNWVFVDWNNQRGVRKDHPDNGSVLLRVRPERFKDQHRRQWRESVQTAAPIPARLVAALVPKPIVITGWSLASQAAEKSTRATGGAKSTHLAVPAGAVYYFEVDASDGNDPTAHARNLLAALNWHGAGQGNEIKNRRSTLLGEKGFGLGVCGTWTPLTEPPPHVRGRRQS